MSFGAFYDLLALHNRDRESTPYLYRDGKHISLHFDLAVTQSTMLESEPNQLFLGYTRSMMGCLLFNPAPTRVALIGLGGGSLAKYCYHHLPDTCTDVAEISADVISLRDTFLIPKDDERFTVQCCDGAEFIAEASSTYDWIMADGFDINGQAPSLATREFYESCYETLSPNGMLIVNLDSCDPDHSKQIGLIRQCFDRAVLNIPAEDSYNKIVFAFKNRAVLDHSSDWNARARALEVKHKLDLRKTARDLQTSKFRDKRFL